MATESDAKTAYLNVFDTMLAATGTTLDNLKYTNRKIGVDYEYKECRVQIGNEFAAIIDNGDDNKPVRYTVFLNINGTEYIKKLEIESSDYTSRETTFLSIFQPILDAEYQQAVSMAEKAATRLEDNLNNQ
jgi:hypothetical protein